MKYLKIFLLFCFIGVAYSQNGNTSKSFYLTFSAGTALNNPVSYYFFRETDDRLINPGFYTSIAVGYGAFDLIELTQLFLSFSIGYTKVSTSEFQLEYFPSKAKLIIETFPMLFWSRLQTNSKLSPFIEIGIGFSKLNFIERYSDRLNGASFSYWALGY